jgi:hypothetical protein
MQVVGDINAGIGGVQLGLGPGSTQVVQLFGSGDPNTIVSPCLVSASTGSTFLRVDGGTSTSFYVKTAQPQTWTAK